MNVAAVVVEHLEYDECLRTLQMQADPGRTLTIAFADEFDEPCEGPFHFLDEHNKKLFEKEFAECKTLKLSKSNFTLVDGEYHFHTFWQGIPTRPSSLSYYSLSLPEFAVPSKIRFTDPHSHREFSKHIIRDDRRNCFVAYLACRSSHGSFDFLLELKFRNERDNFYRTKYADAHTSPHGAKIDEYESLVPAHLREAVREFLSPKAGPLAPSSGGVPSGGVPSQLELLPSVTLISADLAKIVGGRTTQESTEPKKSSTKLPDQLPPKHLDMSRYFDGARLTERQLEVASLAWEYEMSIGEIARRLGKHRSTIQERLAAAKIRIDRAGNFERRAAARAKRLD